MQETCIFCNTEIATEDLAYTEDAEPCHIKCLESFQQHWIDRSEAIDLMGY